ncbi:MAG: hypothetical protein KIT10_12970 [Flavobacteriales bacterium]|nr:hypothetical protein [Flavobacteriales bacterium]
MRRWALVPVLCWAMSAHAQPAWLPLSRDVERPHAKGLQAVGSEAHTAIRPYRREEVQALAVEDSIRLSAVLPALDRWAGVRNGRKFRWGPLLDASAGFSAMEEQPLLPRAGAGFWSDLDLGDKWSFHLDAQTWGERFVDYMDTLVRATRVAPGEGYAYGDGPEFGHFEVNGQVSWDPGRFFNLTAGRGRNAIGDGHRSMMLSDEAASYPFLRITTSVWRIRYMNLFARMSDIRGSRGYIGDYRPKYASMHYLSWNITKRINVGLFEAIMWSAGDSTYPRGFDLHYLNPLIFYRPVEFQIGSPDNALLGGSFSVKVWKHTMVYGQVMLDELLLDEVRGGKGWWANKQSLQLGVVAREAFGVHGLHLRAEWDYVRPFMYTHSDTRQNYAHFGQPLAHPFGSNVQEAIVHAERDHGRWMYGLRTSMAWLGSDTEYSYGNNIFRPERDRPRDAGGNPVNYGYYPGNASLVTLFHGEARGGFLLDPSTGTRLEASYLYRQRDAEGGNTTTTHFFRLGVVCHLRERHPEQEVRYLLP